MGTMPAQLLSSDSHIVEPPDLWEKRLPEGYRDRGPTVVRESDGTDFWYVDGFRTCSFTGGIQMGLRFERPQDLRSAGSFDEVRPGAYLPDAHLAENEQDRVFGSVLYPSAGLIFYGNIPDRDYFSAVCRAYNDWLADFCSHDPKRIKGMAMINVDDVGEGVAELERIRANGLSGALIPVYPDPHRPYSEPEYEPLWSAAEALAAPLGLHIGTNRVGQTARGLYQRLSQSTLATQDYWVRRSLADMIFTGVFERHPRLKVGSIEHELGWAPYFVDTLDYTYTQRPNRPGWTRFDDADVLPSDFFRRNVFVSFQEDLRGLRDRDVLGVQSLLWGSDYPHTETTFPRSVGLLDDLFERAGVPADERQRIACDNARDLYGFELSAGA
jgi:predicted TIM-barrel fold metal-dependent hydrolase